MLVTEGIIWEENTPCQLTLQTAALESAVEKTQATILVHQCIFTGELPQQNDPGILK